MAGKRLSLVECFKAQTTNSKTVLCWLFDNEDLCRSLRSENVR